MITVPVNCSIRNSNVFSRYLRWYSVKPTLCKLPITIGVFTLYGSVLYIIQYRTELEHAEYIHTYRYICWYLKNTLYGMGPSCIVRIVYCSTLVPVPTKRTEPVSGLFTVTTLPVPGTVLPSHLASGLHGIWIHPINWSLLGNVAVSNVASNVAARKVKLGCKKVMPLTVYHVCI